MCFSKEWVRCNMKNKSIVALIPARSGSSRIEHKNIIHLDGHPLLAHSIHCAKRSGIFEAIVCVTDNLEYAEIARHYGAEVPSIRPASISGELSPDIEWVQWIMSILEQDGRKFDAYSIMRPTSPFRCYTRVQEAWDLLNKFKGKCDSLRAMCLCTEHPAKMWVIDETIAHPLFPFGIDGIPWHSNQYQKLPPVYKQNASLEMSWTSVLQHQNSISGSVVLPLVTDSLEAFDINNQIDLDLARYYLEQGTLTIDSIQNPYLSIK
jgi:CMP-N,N'-diacetyllegionaminic acid synthase